MVGCRVDRWAKRLRVFFRWAFPHLKGEMRETQLFSGHDWVTELGGTPEFVTVSVRV